MVLELGQGRDLFPRGAAADIVNPVIATDPRSLDPEANGPADIAVEGIADVQDAVRLDAKPVQRGLENG
jgi:hypothetical protein